MADSKVTRLDEVRARAQAEPPPIESAPLELYEDELSVANVDVSLSDFYAYMPGHNYLFVPAREPWPAASVNARVSWPLGSNGKKVRPSDWLDENRPVDQMTWAPGMPRLISDRLVDAGGWITRPGCNTFNLYREPTAIPGDATKAGPWLDHFKEIYPDNVDHAVAWLAHHVQRPGAKINHALVLGGAQGIGKDTILEPVKYAVGPWNFVEVSPGHMFGRFNGFVKSVILRISEARDLGDVDRFAFYDHMKIYTAAPPDVLRCDEKNLREHAVMNVCGVIITSNHKQDGIYLPADDRRHYVAWSERTKEEFSETYWRNLYGWYAAGGIGHVSAYLASLDLSGFNSKAPPPKTAAFQDIVDANRAPEDAEMADALDALQHPQAVTVELLCTYASESFREFLKERRNSRQIPHRLEAAGYVAVRNDSQTDGRWKVEGRNVAIYARRELSIRDRIVAATAIGRREYRR